MSRITAIVMAGIFVLGIAGTAQALTGDSGPIFEGEFIDTGPSGYEVPGGVCNHPVGKFGDWSYCDHRGEVGTG
jgi:hypothetical protein